jgi:hypothetical protein
MLCVWSSNYKVLDVFIVNLYPSPHLKKKLFLFSSLTSAVVGFVCNKTVVTKIFVDSGIFDFWYLCVRLLVISSLISSNQQHFRSFNFLKSDKLAYWT